MPARRPWFWWLAVALLAGAPEAAAQTCAGEVYRLARQYGLPLESVLRPAAAEAPTRPPASSLGESLAQSEAIIRPPVVDRTLALAPPTGDVGDSIALAPPTMRYPWRGALGALDAGEQAAMAARLQARR